jgi:hypothetical protein
MTRLSTGQYQVKLPFKQNCPVIPSNFDLAKKQVISRIHKLKKDTYKKYNEQIENYIRDGQVEEIPLAEREGSTHEEVHYLTHHGVVKPEKNTPLRVVFNASLGKTVAERLLAYRKEQSPINDRHLNAPSTSSHSYHR